MTIAADLLQRHIHTLVADNGQWQTLIADDLVWELPYAPALGHPNGSDRGPSRVRPQGPVEILRVSCGAGPPNPDEPVEGTVGTPGILSQSLP